MNLHRNSEGRKLIKKKFFLNDSGQNIVTNV
jgi:hypothetical protein